MSIIEINNLSYTYPGESEPVLRNIGLEIEQGDFTAIIGNNGCGKSTLCKVLNGLIPHFISGDFTGEVIVDGENTLQSDVGALAKKVGYVYQDFENQIVRPTVLDDASYACLNYGMTDYRERGLNALEQSGLHGKENDYIWQLSGGQTHLLALAGALALGPDILILDEPIAQLDPGHADSIYEVLQELNEKYGKTIIVIEHHTEYIANYCKNVLLLKKGQVAWKLPACDALTRVEELLDSNIYPPQVTQAGYRLNLAGLADSRLPLPTTIEEGSRFFAGLDWSKTALGQAAPKEETSPEVAASFQGVSLAYRSVKGEPHTVFNQIDLELYRGEKIAVIGSNGAGKSTLMKLMTGLLKPSEGRIEICGTDIREMKPESLSQKISMVYQNPEDMFIKDSIYNDISYAMQVRNVDGWEEKTKALLERFRLMELTERDGRLLSGGQMRRASLAIGIALNPGILLLDEPTANLDIATRKEILQTLEDMKDITETVLIATHDMQLVAEWASRIIVLCHGTIVADGSRDEIFGDCSLAKLVGIRPPEIFTMGQALNTGAFCYTVNEFMKAFTKAGRVE